ncbi:MAG TPA: type II toxin-antitoxin system HicB family antitoxin [Candidatus Saccharimonadales bacterium]|nr:type II toxin-antitoxin system HicB family antitoxin [Candidatus Saccharimonadales bacterium]
MQKKTLDIQEYELPITIQEEKDGGFTAVCSLWKDCYAQGETVEEVINEISYVASSLVELYKEEDIEIPLTLKKTEKSQSRGFNLNIPLIVSVN